MFLYNEPLKIELHGNELLVNGTEHPKDVRTMAQMQDTLMEEVQGEWDAYFMYRGVHSIGDIRYDITVIPSIPMGKECPKTYGHYHPASKSGIEFPEIYQVLNGSAVYILQKRNRNGSVNTTVVDAKKGDVVLMPPGYGHVTVNNGKEPLVMGNLVYGKFSSEYSEYKKNRGGAYYYLLDHQLVQNTNYFIEKNERIDPAALNKRYGITATDLLSEFCNDASKFAYLENPGLISE